MGGWVPLFVGFPGKPKGRALAIPEVPREDACWSKPRFRPFEPLNP